MKFVREALLAEPGITMWIMIIVMTLLMQSRMLSRKCTMLSRECTWHGLASLRAAIYGKSYVKVSK